MKTTPAPLFRDPIYDGAADPMVIYNDREHTWWMLYTQRRANVDSPGVAYCYGSAIGIAESVDGGNEWVYRGALNLEFERGHNTFWAPEVIFDGKLYHMFVSYTRGIYWRFCGHEKIIHYTSDNLWDWQYFGEIILGSGSVIDVCAFQLPDGGYRMWYKNEEDHSHIWSADSTDLYEWSSLHPVITDYASEGPNVFKLGHYYWLIVDCWDGLGVYRSLDLNAWEWQHDKILRYPGKRPEDGEIGRHADVVVSGNEGYIFYFTHPERSRDFNATVNDSLPYGMVPYSLRRSSIQAARITVKNGVLTCNRDETFTMALPMV